MNTQIFQTIAKFIADKKAGWVVTVIENNGSSPGKSGMKMVVDSQGAIEGTVGGGAVELLIINKLLKEKPIKTEKWRFDLGKDNPDVDTTSTGMICGGTQEVLIEPLFVPQQLYIMGGGHCGQALSELATKCGFDVTVIDDREEFVTKSLHPYASKLICCPYTEIDKHIHFSHNTFLVALTHGHRHDENVMRALINKQYKYFGIIGSEHKVLAIFQKMLKDGFAKEELRRLCTPIGLNIGSQTPPEIAVSIMAQIIAKKNSVTEIVINSNPWN